MRSDRVAEGPVSKDIVFHEPGSPGEDALSEGSDRASAELQMRIVRHCAPTLAGMKCGSMFRLKSDPHDIGILIADIDRRLSDRGVRAETLRNDREGCLVYIYRPKILSSRMEDPAVCSILERYGYGSGDIRDVLDHLRHRFEHCPSIPPEVGVFLDYPAEDVIGYIENEGRCCKCVGCWKVYGDVAEAERRFQCFRKCRNVFIRRFEEGSHLERLTVRC